ncbi:hypothetical protein [Corynebacterium cystitidis]|uniref:Uncharacterized protein n=1 Tax=Corynebacterium cystitidis DSM 20524 TaxID=1121357 RepID=A0A1H9UW01_9CORY|nr:hypothetical protein [Corynebacterium cystitidis]WJY83678.1 hypothetical protein CCYS_13985 [Corynebacterium cystitidis DSM 20524]SES13655.1 hypothetical protein SAMN05661109_01958 [Corynebacterium cystitidis DSM 20524]SNV91363.1 Uncharacterised protein [Corynebacterium cystitidis]
MNTYGPIPEDVGDGAIGLYFGVVEEGVPAERAVFDLWFSAGFGELLLVVLVGTMPGLPVVDLVGDNLVDGNLA